ncbi:MAG: WecB/TagA/CpsF family glycosyltransferase [Rhodothermales bacterium]|nr:WecB/TagA/CpsF family glycosyltransferase [Rhodothermales bacterium]
MQPPVTDILGLRVSAVDIPRALATIDGWIARREPRYACVSNVHSVMESWDDPALRRIHNEAGLVTPDGMPLVWISRLRGRRHVRRVYGPDLMLALCAHGLERGYRHYFYGGADGVAGDLARRLGERFPGLVVAGAETPPFRPLTPEEDAAAVERINAARPDVVWVGLGMPKQERWMHAHVGRIEAPALIGVGAAFDFHTGRKPQAPAWMQRTGLEWAFRLATEPRRLAGRYLRHNPRFVGLALLELMRLRPAPRP